MAEFSEGEFQEVIDDHIPAEQVKRLVFCSGKFYYDLLEERNKNGRNDVAFVREMLRLAQKIIPDHELSIEDLMAICHMALDRREAGIVMLEGRHLRGRVAEQMSRADRYDEPFSLMVLRLEELPDKAAYESVVETLCERMRKTDLMFMFKHRIVLVLPHTPVKPRRMLEERTESLTEIRTR